MVIASPFDETTLERIRACKQAEFPICLNESIKRMFGENGKKTLDRIVMNETFENSAITSPNDIWNLYKKYMERVSNILGEDVKEVIEYENLKEMESMLCTK